MKIRLKKWFQSEVVWVLLIALLTSFSSEIKLSPFSGENFRFGLGTIIFLLMLLIRPPKNTFFGGIVTAIVVVGFRMIMQLIFDDKQIIESLVENYPAGIYYFIYILGFKLFRVAHFFDRPLKLGLVATLLEIISNSMEHILRILLTPMIETDLNDWLLLAAVALFRSFFVVGLYSSISLTEQRKRLEENLTVGSDLYIETLYLKKSMNHIEQIMADSYDLYRLLKPEQKELSKKALLIAQEIHEVKKDSQRIYSGLSEITLVKEQDSYLLSEVLDMVVEGNRKYAIHLNKHVAISCSSAVDFSTREQLLLLSILNNIVANAVEATKNFSEIRVTIKEMNTFVQFNIEDSGQGISKEDLALIFEPGFTTKFNDKGVAATGIGLSHVQEALKQLDGVLNMSSEVSVGTRFTIEIPRSRIEQGE